MKNLLFIFFIGVLIGFRSPQVLIQSFIRFYQIGRLKTLYTELSLHQVPFRSPAWHPGF